MELLDVVDEHGVPTGEVVSRDVAHRTGVRHRTSHVWMLRKKNGRLEILAQKRSENKDSHPGCYDISSAGHIPAGEDFVSSALRELEEELGVTAKPEDLVYCGQRHFAYEKEFYGEMFRDDQVSNVYYLWCDKEPEEFVLQKEEVSEVRWFAFSELLDAVEKNRIPNCIHIDELEMVLAKEQKEII